MSPLYIHRTSSSSSSSSSSSTGCNQQRKMFPSNHADQCLLGEQSFSRNDPPTSSFFHFSPFLDHNTRFLSHENELLSGHLTKSPQMALAGDFLGANNAGMAVLGATQNSFSSKNSSPVAAGRKRSSNRERHSKIFTAQGLRDRRMRLSVDVARKFFGLQDMLGFDKASKTIGWLMMKSKAAIKELARGANSTSESEEISGVDETAAAADADQQEEEDLKEKSLEDNAKAKRVQGSKKATVCQAAKESRAIARAKARERTREKMSIRLEKSKQLPKGSSHGVQQLSPSIPLGSSAEDSSSRISPGRKSFELGVEINEPNKLGLSTYGYPHHSLNAQGESGGDLASFNNNGMMTFFAENWDMGSSTRTRLSCCDAPNMHLFTPGF